MGVSYELKLIARLERQLATLDAEARSRVLGYLNRRQEAGVLGVVEPERPKAGRGTAGVTGNTGDLPRAS